MRDRSPHPLGPTLADVWRQRFDMRVVGAAVCRQLLRHHDLRRVMTNGTAAVSSCYSGREYGARDHAPALSGGGMVAAGSGGASTERGGPGDQRQERAPDHNRSRAGKATIVRVEG